jgi:predicted GH43/DUF377 family glycosyl hydrolase
MSKYTEAFEVLQDFKKKYETAVELEHHTNDIKIRNKILKSNPLSDYLDEIPKQYDINNTKLIDSKMLVHSYDCNGINNIKPQLWFNCSMVEYSDGYLLVYRTDLKNEKLKRWCVNINLHLVKLNKKYKVVGENKTLTLHTNPKSFLDKYIKDLPKGHHCEDPRMIIHNNKIFLFYTDGFKQLLALINLDSLDVEHSDYLETPFNTQFEKNWTPLIKNNELYLVYGYSPLFTVIKLNNSNPWVIDAVISQKTLLKDVWKYGEIRGGTPWIKTHDDKYYISMFHSSKQLTPIIEYSKVYYAGIILLNKDMVPVAISKTPVIRGEIQSFTIDRLNQNIFVVFPGGIVYDYNKEKYLISFGYNDYECRILEIEKDKIYNDLVWINKH